MAVISKESKKRLWRCGEVLLASTAILTVWALYSVPTIIMFRPSENGDSSSAKEGDSGACDHQIYEGACMQHLLTYQSCVINSFTDNGTTDGVVYIPESTANLEATARLIVPAIDILNPSPECEAELAPFICLNLFGLCGDNGTVLRPSSRQCHRVTTDICAREWMTAIELATMFQGQVGSFDIDTTFPDCLTFPNETSCDIISNTMNTTVTTAMTASTNTQRNNTDNSDNASSMAQCSPDFYMNSTGLCLPLCAEWKLQSETTSAVVKTIILLSVCVFLIATSVVLVLSCIRYKRMLKFPSVFLIYQLMSISAVPLIWLIGYTATEKLYCSHRGFVDSVFDPTNFCYFTGIVQYFSPLLAVCLWLCHILVVLRGIMCPFRARATLNDPKSARCHHMVLLSLCILLPAAITAGTFGYGDYVTFFPPSLCTSEKTRGHYFSTVLPMTILCAAGVTSLIIILALLLRRKKTKQRGYVEAEMKILISFIYYICVTLVNIIGQTILLRDTDKHQEELLKYFLCESHNVDGRTCSRSGFESVDKTYITIPCIAIVLAIYPLVILTYVISTKDVKQCFPALMKKCSCARRKLKQQRCFTTSTGTRQADVQGFPNSGADLSNSHTGAATSYECDVTVNGRSDAEKNSISSA